MAFRPVLDPVSPAVRRRTLRVVCGQCKVATSTHRSWASGTRGRWSTPDSASARGGGGLDSLSLLIRRQGADFGASVITRVRTATEGRKRSQRAPPLCSSRPRWRQPALVRMRIEPTSRFTGGRPERRRCVPSPTRRARGDRGPARRRGSPRRARVRRRAAQPPTVLDQKSLDGARTSEFNVPVDHTWSTGRPSIGRLAPPSSHPCRSRPKAVQGAGPNVRRSLRPWSSSILSSGTEVASGSPPRVAETIT